MHWLNLLCVWVLSFNGSWKAADVEQFWVEPNISNVFKFEQGENWKDTLNTEETEVNYIIKTTDGLEYEKGVGILDGNFLQIQTILPQGFFELELLDTKQTFGIASQPFYISDDELFLGAVSESRDSFFGIDSASTWLVGDNKIRESLIKNARRLGLTFYRERFSWNRIESQKNMIDASNYNDSEFVRATAHKYNLPILELFHSTPEWTGKIGKYPMDLIATADSWAMIAEKWNKYWGALEVWNEPDISFSGDLPADQYATILKTISQEFRRCDIETPVIGGIIANFRDSFMDCLADNNVLEACDIFSYHTYNRAFEMEEISLRYFYWLQKNNAIEKPIWITECGRPWKKGTERPDREADLISAIDIVQKGVVTKALGYDAYFPFVYPYYEENDNNFGMCDKNYAPLRSIASYARLIYLLSGKECYGSWKLNETELLKIERSYLFKDCIQKKGKGTSSIAVLYTRDFQPNRKIILPCHPVFVERITGEQLSVNDNNEVDFSDGFLYVGLPTDYSPSLMEKSEVDIVRELRYDSLKRDKKVPIDHSIVLRYDFDENVVSPNVDGYVLKDPEKKVFNGQISVYNFNKESVTLPISCSAKCNNVNITAEINLQVNAETLEIPARGCTTFSFTLDITKISPLNPTVLTFQVSSEDKLTFMLKNTLTEKNLKKFAGKIGIINVSDRKRWHSNITAGGSVDFCMADELNKDSTKVGYKANFIGTSDRWTYPKFFLTSWKKDCFDQILNCEEDGKKIENSELKGVAFYVTGTSDDEKAVVRFFTYDQDNANYFFTSAPLAKADGQKRFVVVLFDSLSKWGTGKEKFNLSNVSAISVGGNVEKGEYLNIEISDLYFF